MRLALAFGFAFGTDCGPRTAAVRMPPRPSRPWMPGKTPQTARRGGDGVCRDGGVDDSGLVETGGACDRTLRRGYADSPSGSGGIDRADCDGHS